MTPRRAKPYDSVKRLVDVAAAGSVLLLTAPLQLVIAALVRRNLGSPVLFRQRRPGLVQDHRAHETTLLRGSTAAHLRNSQLDGGVELRKWRLPPG